MAWAQVATRGPVPGLRACFWTPFLFSGPVLDPLYLPEACFWSLFFCAGLFLDPPCLPQTCFWNPFVFRGHVFTCPLSSAGVSLDCLYFVFHHGFVFGSLLWAPWWSVLGLHFGAGGPFWGSVLVPVVRLGVSVWLTFMAPSSRPRKYKPKSLKRPSHERTALSWSSSLFLGSLLLGKSRSALQSAKRVQAACTIAKAD